MAAPPQQLRVACVAPDEVGHDAVVRISESHCKGEERAGYPRISCRQQRSQAQYMRRSVHRTARSLIRRLLSRCNVSRRTNEVRHVDVGVAMSLQERCPVNHLQAAQLWKGRSAALPLASRVNLECQTSHISSTAACCLGSEDSTIKDWPAEG